jgi:hypothetical protein
MSTKSLAEMVELCGSCESECSKRSERFLIDVKPAPALGRTATENNDRLRRDTAFQKCMIACQQVSNQCPSPSFIRQVVREQEEEVQRAKAAGGDGKIVYGEAQYSLRRCEGLVQNFVSVLFAIANQPTTYDANKDEDYYGRRQKEVGGPAARNSTAGLGGTDFASEALASRAAAGGGTVGADMITRSGVTAEQLQRTNDGQEILPGTAHLSAEQRAQLQKFQQMANPGAMKAAGGTSTGAASSAGGGGGWFR